MKKYSENKMVQRLIETAMRMGSKEEPSEADIKMAEEFANTLQSELEASGKDLSQTLEAASKRKLSNDEKEELRKELAERGFFKKGGWWNLGMFADVGDIFRAKKANDIVVSIENVALKATGIATAGYFGYKGIASLLDTSSASVAGGALMAAVKMGGARLGG
jgi:hypothetical protein